MNSINSTGTNELTVNNAGLMMYFQNDGVDVKDNKGFVDTLREIQYEGSYATPKGDQSTGRPLGFSFFRQQNQEAAK